MELLNFELLRILVAVGGTALAAWQDAKTSFIDDKILFSMIGVGALLTLASADSELILYTGGVAAFIFAFGYLLYRQGQLGMGDVLLFVGLQLLLPFHPQVFSDWVRSPLPYAALGQFALPASAAITLKVLAHLLFFMTIFMVSSYVATIASSAFYAKRLIEKVLSKKTRLKPNVPGTLLALLLVGMASFFLYSILGVSIAALLFFLLLLSTAFFLSFRDQLLREIVTEQTTLKDIEDEDILALDQMPPHLVKKYRLGKVLTTAEVAKLKIIAAKEGLKRFPVYKVLPRFGPYILIGLLAALLWGDLFSLLMAFA